MGNSMPPMMGGGPPKPVSDTATAALRAAQAAAADLAKLANLTNKGKSDEWKAPEQSPQKPTIKREPNDSSGREGRPRKKRSRWGQPDAKTVIPGMPAAV